MLLFRTILIVGALAYADDVVLISPTMPVNLSVWLIGIDMLLPVVVLEMCVFPLVVMI